MKDEETVKSRALAVRQTHVQTDTLNDKKYIKKLEYLQIKDQFENASNTKETRRLLRSINKQRKADGKRKILGIWIGCRKHKFTTKLNWIYEHIKQHAVAIILLTVMLVLKYALFPAITEVTNVEIVKYCVSALGYILIVYAIWHFVLWPIRKYFKHTLCPKCKKGIVFFDGMKMDQDYITHDEDSMIAGTFYKAGSTHSIGDYYYYLVRKCANCGETFKSNMQCEPGLTMKTCEFIGDKIAESYYRKENRNKKRETAKNTTADEKKQAVNAKKQAVKEKKEKELESLKNSLEDITKKQA